MSNKLKSTPYENIRVSKWEDVEKINKADDWSMSKRVFRGERFVEKDLKTSLEKCLNRIENFKKICLQV